MASGVKECPSYGTTIHSTKSAMDKVLDTAEILEMILARVDMRTLLTSVQRVCHNWVNLISKSPSIQKALFFTPIKDSEWGVKETILNPLLAETFPSIFPAKNRLDYYKFDFSDLIMTKNGSTMAHFVRENASWRKMLVQQPPISDIGLLYVSQGMMGDCAGSSSISLDKKKQESGYDGIRMERLFELLLTLHFSEFTKVRVYWSTEVPVIFQGSFQKNICNEFDRIISKFGLVVYTGSVVQCSWNDSPPTTAELTQKEIITAYGEHGLDFDERRKYILESKSEATAFQEERAEYLSYSPSARLSWDGEVDFNITSPTSPGGFSLESEDRAQV
ncbi:hypothetical protein N7447_003938 [Penicillium robsamsonii]|uniref:uncharacterized protein n=1 Tax=Penicillium robsamsonii TaxID=1792511 RepID=UPI002548C74A|nr:uncharacterized protein N7447_003938 [Penicillium robsamsonii]KAJ5827175.1 hypothetical protein N7447_003938 [Penicillium robsamsonii]